jgi:hypothetical protein
LTDFFTLARRARSLNPTTEVGYREDGSLVLALGSEEATCPVELDGLPLEPRVVHYHPAKGWSVEQAAADVKALRARYPQAWIHGLSPAWLQGKNFELVQIAGLDSFCLYTGEVGGAATGAAAGWEECLNLDIPVQASFSYGPNASLEDIRERLHRIGKVTSVLPLPLAIGDRIVLPGATTAGVQDIEVLATCGCELPGAQVRASWAALGWKIGQATVAFGATELTGWGLEEMFAYSSRSRPAGVVGRAEVLQGIEEIQREPRECH